MTLKVEYFTKVSDYDLNTKQEVFYILSRNKLRTEVFSEKIKVPTEYQTGREIPLDSKTSWRISPHRI